MPRERGLQAIRVIERRALQLAAHPRRNADARTLDLRIIERQLAVLVLAVETAYPDQPSARPSSAPS